MRGVKMNCQDCDSIEIVKNGFIHNSKQKYLCKNCDRQFVENPQNKIISQSQRKIVGVYVGSRDHIGAQGLWESLPAVYRQCAVCYTDFWAAYNKVLPTKRHHAVGKESGKTNHIERFNLTMRQRISRLVRKTRIILKFHRTITTKIERIPPLKKGEVSFSYMG
jgi:IS1 family transposase